MTRRTRLIAKALLWCAAIIVVAIILGWAVSEALGAFLRGAERIGQ